MNIAIDGNEANVENKVGIGEYAFQVISNLYKYRDSHNFIIYLKNNPRLDLPPVNNNWTYKVIGPKPLWTQLALPLALYTGKKADVIFSPTHYSPRFSPVPRIVSIMDLSYIHYPKLFNKDDIYKLVRWTKNSINVAQKIITISNFTKQEIINYYKINSQDIYVTYLGYKKDVYRTNYSKGEISEIKKKYNLEKFLIFVGTIQPRKNILKLIEAYRKLILDFPGLKLVIIGKKGWLFDEIFKVINRTEFKDKILYLDYLNNIEIAKLYNSALAFILPSLYEGFGLTVIEAMACGCPVVVSNVSSLPEIANKTAVYINPNSSEDIKNGIEKVIRNDQSFFRDNLTQKGLERVKLFSWEKCAAETLSVIESLK